MKHSVIHRAALCGLMLVILISSVLVAPVTSQVQAKMAGDEMVVVHVYYTTRAQLATLVQTLDVWESHPDELRIVAYMTQTEMAALQAQGYRVVLDAAKTTAANAPRVVSPNQLAGIPSYPCYRTVEETYATLLTLNTTYPNLVLLQNIGMSWDKVNGGGPAGYDIKMIRLTNENFTPAGGKFRFFLMAEIHAREYVTAETATRLAEYLLQNYGVDPDITWLLDYGEIHIVPMSNPDGRKKAEAGALWRKNTDSDDGCAVSTDWGTDLNRNSSTLDWGGEGTSDYPCDETYHGPSAGSEPETATIQNYVTSILADQRGSSPTDPAPDDYQGLFITLHSYSGLVLWPWGSVDADAPNGTDLQTLGRKMAYFNGYEPQQSVELYPTSGGTDDWAYETLGVPGYTFEMGTEFFEDCNPFNNTIYPDNRDALLYAFKAARRPYMTPAGPEVLNAAVNPLHVMPSQPVTLSANANDTRYQNNYGTEPSQAIQAARYSVDQPSWISGVVTYPMQAADGSFNSSSENLTAVLDTSSLAPGKHTLFIEAQDAAGNWGVPTAVFLQIDVPADGYASLTPTASQVVGGIGDSVTHNITLTNIGLSQAVFDLTLSNSPAWAVEIAPTQVTLASNESVTVTATVSIPSGAAGGSTDLAQITATPQGYPQNSASASLTTMASKVNLTPATAASSGAPGSVVSYTLTISNSSTKRESFDFHFSTHDWVVTVAPPLPSVAAGSSANVTVNVSVPAGTPLGAFEVLSVRTEMRSDRQHSDTSVLTTTAAEFYGVDVAANPITASGEPGDVLTYALTVTNLGNVSDTFDLGTAGNNWLANLPASVGPLAAGASQTLDVTVTIPADAVVGASDSLLVTAVSQHEPDAADSLTLISGVELQQYIYIPLLFK